MTLRRRSLLLSPLALAACATPGTADDPGRTVAGPEQGFGAGTRGGADADPADDRTVHTRAELDAALALGDRPKIIRLAAHIDLAADAPASDFNFEAYAAAYDPATWGRRPPAGPLEDARQQAARRHAAAVTLRLPPNTTLIGVVPGAGFSRGMLLLDGVQQLILRHLDCRDAWDPFPAWDPLDGAQGEWNSDVDTVSLRRTQQVWVDHCRFADVPRAPRTVFGRHLQHQDGLLDITRQSDRVSVSWCRFEDHDKTMLIGGSDRHSDDEGRLRVTLHHNLWQRVRERTPRVRYGQVQLVNNLFVVEDTAAYAYSIGVGRQARIHSEANAWQTPPGVAPAQLLRRLGEGAAFVDRGSVLNGAPLVLGADFPAPPAMPKLLAEPAAVAARRVRAGSGPRPGRIGHNDI